MNANGEIKMFRLFVLFMLKVILTPLVVVFLLLPLTLLLIKSFLDWVLDCGKYEKQITKQMTKDLYDFIKEWFTTL